ncbi:MAG: hypothetical protein WC551_10375 [Patescibacteria group bacterium]
METLYRTKTVVFRAVQITDGWFNWKDHPPEEIPVGTHLDPGNRSVMVKTPDGKMHGYVGDYLVTGPDGVVRVYEEELFKQLFELVLDNPLRPVCFAVGCDSRCTEPRQTKEISDAADSL